MWTAYHHDWCTDRLHYKVVETLQQVHKTDGTIVDDGHLNNPIVRAQCGACGAKAKWIPYEDIIELISKNKLRV